MWQADRGTSGVVRKGSKQADGLNGLAQAHLVCQHHILVLLPGMQQPVQAFQLVAVQLAAVQKRRRLQESARALTLRLSQSLQPALRPLHGTTAVTACLGRRPGAA